MIEYFVSYFDPESQSIKTGFVDSRIFDNVRMNLVAEHEVGPQQPIDDEFARRFGGTALLWFATQYPELRKFLGITDGNGNVVSL
ncbi:hypothetical protein [Caballeronia glebae]|jgi:hypothetical protein|uniref:Uncharacterized protein n=1 Tax=Caballeronia glebae TaxID=1777143 RepID=A0A158CS95_9BURK|nr:hypothetical protein [Caballeronia glebae]SAK85091.1 hypothetical protein AWB82_05750 [Caballeronia glebae]